METKNKKDNLIKRFSYILLGCVILGGLSYVTYRLSCQVYKQRQINNEIISLQKEIERLHQENQDLNKLISYIQTDSFKERQTKDKLNLIKEGEQLVLVKDSSIQGDQKEDQEENVDKKRGVEIVVNYPNYYHWWYYFFSLDSVQTF